nr:MAG TPA: hypothetical protein [Caudoviricetes sp.]
MSTISFSPTAVRKCIAARRKNYFSHYTTSFLYNYIIT